MGPPKLEDPLLELLARGASRAVLITDRLMAGADTRATARARVDSASAGTSTRSHAPASTARRVSSTASRTQSASTLRGRSDRSALTSGSWSISSTCGSARSRSVRDGFAMETPFSNTGAGMRGRRGRSPTYTSVARADAPTAGYRFGDATSRTTRWGNCRGKRFCFSLRPRVAVPYRAASQGTREEAATRQGRNQMRS